MEWREQTSVSCEDAFTEAQRWLEEVTRKSFGSNNFRSALENGVLLCDLINELKPGIIKRLNRLSTPIAGLDNISVFLRACEKLGLNQAQLFHPGDLQDLSTRATLRCEETSRRLKNVLITIYWLGRKAQADPFYSGPQLNLKAFEGLLGIALSKALEDSVPPKGGGSGSVRDSGFSETWYPEREEIQRVCLPTNGRQDSVDSCDSVESPTLKARSEGWCSDTEAEQGFRMQGSDSSGQRDRGNVPSPLRRKRVGQGCPSPLTRHNQVNPGWIWSKSFDIDLQMVVARIKDGEVLWHDDLSKWKTLRRSVTSGRYRKVQIASGGGANTRDAGNLRGLQEERDQQESSGSSASSSTVQVRPRTQAQLTRGYAIEGPYSPHTSTLQTPRPSSRRLPASQPPSLGEKTHTATVALDGATTPTSDSPFSSKTQFQTQAQTSPALLMPLSGPDQTGTTLTDQTVTTTITMLMNGTTSALTNGTEVNSQGSLAPVDPTGDAPISGPVEGALVIRLGDPVPQPQPQQNGSMPRKEHQEQARSQTKTGLYRYSSRASTGGSVGGSVSATLPRGYRRSEGSSRLSAITTPRPFGAKPSRVTSLPRLYRHVIPPTPPLTSLRTTHHQDDHKSVLNGEQDRSQLLTGPSHHKPVTASQVKGQPRALASPGNGLQEVKMEEQRQGRSATPVSQTRGPLPRSYSEPHPHAHPSPHPSPHPCPRSSLTSLPSDPTPSAGLENRSAQVRHSDKRVSLSLKPNSRPDFGFQTHWDSTGARVKAVHTGSPAELCQLRAGDEIVAVNGRRVAEMSYDQWKGTMSSALQQGNLTMDIRHYGNNDEYWGSGLPSQTYKCRKTINLAAATQHVNARPDSNISMATVVKPAQLNGQAVNGVSSKGMNGGFRDDARTIRNRGGSESAISDLQVPSLSTSPSSWSWDPEEERRRQEKWQEEQERLLQEKYRRDQERLEAEWQQAQQEAGGEGYRKPESTREMTNGFARPASAQAFLSQAMPPVQVSSNHIKESVPDGGREEPAHQEAESQPAGEEQGEESEGVAERDHWTKSRSTPALDGLHKQETRGVTREPPRKSKGRALVGQCVSQAEQERQQILGEMKKRTQLLTDNSWIRQRSTSVTKEPIYMGVPMKKYESMDSLPTSGPTSASAMPNNGRPHSATGYSAPHRSSSSRHSMGAGFSSGSRHSLLSSTTPAPPTNPGEELPGQSRPSSQQSGSVWPAGAISDGLSLECESGTESPTVTLASSDSSNALQRIKEETALLNTTPETATSV